MTPDFNGMDFNGEDVLQFWFPSQINHDIGALVRQWSWWFRGGANAAIAERFVPLLNQASQGELDTWANEPWSRLALIIVLDQFPRSLYLGTAQAYAQDEKARALTLEGIEAGHYEALKTPWEKTFFFLPLGHSEQLNHLDQAINLADKLVQQAAPEYHALLEFSAAQARRHRDVIVRFGRHPHRNQILSRQSTPEEQEYLATGQLVHTHPLPSSLRQFEQ